ncbi:ORF6C domain-containing protein [Bacillus albus]|uniref:ORF6C domain-containing protein n=1 Tax=Bacillus albus TaxID=2026189 RepID=UPI001021460B|nr:ORF6C domain-containing protein [Bacillus albus]
MTNKEMIAQKVNTLTNGNKEVMNVFSSLTNEIDSMRELLAQNSKISIREKDKLVKAVNRKAVELTKKYGSTKVKERVRSKLQGRIFYRFNVNQYENIFKCNYEDVLQFIEKWDIPANILIEIEEKQQVHEG